MRVIFWGIALVLIAIVIYFFILGVRSRTGTALGLVDGELAQCGPKPNCVCSEQQLPTDFYIEPLKPSDIAAEPLAAVKAAIQEMGGEIVAETNDDKHYLAATFSSALFGFVDDLEIRFDPDNQVLQARSASRVGHSDLGANRKRVEQLRSLLQNT